jgi:hypothetical protein
MMIKEDSGDIQERAKMIRVVCECGRAFKAEDRHAGKRTKCPVCGASLSIGNTPMPSSSGSADEIPSWWYPSENASKATPKMTPARKAVDHETHSTMILPGSTQGRIAGQLDRPGAAAPPESGRQPVARGSVSDKKLWALIGGTAVLSILGFAAIFWVRPAGPAVGDGGPAVAPAPEGRPGEPDQSRSPRSTSAGIPREPEAAPDRNPAPDSRGTSASLNAAATAGAGSRASDSPHRLRLLVPAYIYPAGEGKKDWRRLIDAASKVDIVAIVNPSSGPGRERILDYSTIIAEASSRNVTLVGYVSTDYTKRTVTEAKIDVDRWVDYYPRIGGFFFDQQPREGQYASYYAELRDHARSKVPNALLITNPGVPCDEAYLVQAVSSITCVFANFEGFETFELPASLRVFEPTRFAALPYNISTPDQMRTIVRDAIVKRIAYLYVSDAKPPNQWNKLPSFWEAEVEEVSRNR